MVLLLPGCLAAPVMAQNDRDLDATKRVSPLGGRRLALVIGNNDYPWKPLANPVNDANVIAGTLRELGFGSRDVRLVTNANRTDLRRNVREFVEGVKPGDLAFVYYSGHGVEIKGSNYLLPIDLPADATEGYVQDEAVSAQRILEDLTDQGAAVRVLILDACRDNPLRATKSTSGGLGAMQGSGSLIMFSTQAGRTAKDSTLFRDQLVAGLMTPGVSLDEVMKNVSRSVAVATGEKQVPAIYGLLLADVKLAGDTRREFDSSRSPEAFQAGLDAATESWNLIKTSQSADDFDEFSKTFPNSPLAAAARLRAQQLRRGSTVAASTKSGLEAAGGNYASVGGSGTPSAYLADIRTRAHAAFDRDDYAAALPLFLQLGNSATAEEMYDLGYIYDRESLPSGVTKDSKTWFRAGQNVNDGGSSLARFKNRRVTELDRQAAAWYRKAADGGYPNAMINLALMYLNGTGVDQDHSQALTWVHKAIESGSARAMNMLGLLYEDGTAVKQDVDQAVAWFRRSAEVGNALAMVRLGGMYEDGRGVGKDPAQAVTWYRKAATAGDADGMNRLAYMYETGAGVSKDPKQAFSWYRKSAEAGYSPAMDNLGLMYENGEGVDKDVTQAAGWYRKAADAGETSGMNHLALMYEYGTGVEKDYAQAIAWYRKGIDAGDAGSMNNLGVMYKNGNGVEKDAKQAVMWYRKAADAGNLYAMCNLGGLYQEGDGVEKNYDQALTWYRKAADGGQAGAMNGLGTMYENGTGVAKDMDQAVSWYKKAAALGDENAKTNLKRLGK